MTVAMMLPTSLPVIATLHAFASERSDRLLLVVLTVLGYLIVWIFFGALVLIGYLSWQWLLASSPWLAERLPREPRFCSYLPAPFSSALSSTSASKNAVPRSASSSSTGRDTANAGKPFASESIAVSFVWVVAGR